MGRRLTALACVALLAGGTGLAFAARPETAASWAEILTGSDAAGKVRVSYYNDEKRHGLNGSFYTVDYVDYLRLANRCASKGTVVTKYIVVSDSRFHYSHAGVTVAGTFNRALTRVNGTFRIRTAVCDSGIVRFTASGPGHP